MPTFQELTDTHLPTFKKLIKLPKKYRLLIPSALIALIILPVSLWAVAQTTRTRFKAATPSTPPTNITPTITPSPAPSTFGAAVKLNGTDSFIELADFANINPTTNFTVEAWVKPESPVFQHYLISKNSSTSNGYSISMRSFHDTSGGYYVVDYEFRVADANLNCTNRTIASHYTYPETDVEKLTQWQHIAGVIQANGQMDIFVNGKPSTTNSNSISNICQTTHTTSVGARMFSGTNVYDGVFNGAIDDLRVSNIARYTSEFTPPSSPHRVDSNTIALFPFELSLSNYANSAQLGIAHGQLTYTTGVAPSTSPTPTPSAIYTDFVIEPQQVPPFKQAMANVGWTHNGHPFSYSITIPPGIYLDSDIQTCRDGSGCTFTVEVPAKEAGYNEITSYQIFAQQPGSYTLKAVFTQKTTATMVSTVERTLYVFSVSQHPPTPTPTPYPTPAPWFTPTPTPAPSIFPTPPPSFYPPYITTVELPPIRYNRNYTATVTAKDPYSSEMLLITTQGLPEGLALSSCYQTNDGATSCVISGKTRAEGTYQITVIARDSTYLTAQKTFAVTVYKAWYQKIKLFGYVIPL